MKKLLFVSAVLISITVCAGMTSCKAWRKAVSILLPIRVK